MVFRTQVPRHPTEKERGHEPIKRGKPLAACPPSELRDTARLCPRGTPCNGSAGPGPSVKMSQGPHLACSEFGGDAPALSRKHLSWDGDSPVSGSGFVWV